MSLSPTRTVLENGVVCLAKATHATPAVAIHLALQAGSMYDPPDKVGATWLLSRVLDRGTATRSAADIAEDLDSRGISLSITVTRHLLFVTCTCLAEDFEPVLALVGDMFINPAFPEDEIAKRKTEIVTSIRQDEDNPIVRATETLMSLLYPDGHPYGRKTKGSIEVVERIGRDDLVALHAGRFAPSTLSAAIVGDVEPSGAHDVIARVFGGWRRPVPKAVPLASPPPAMSRRRVVIPMMNKAQAEIAYGFTTIRRGDPAFHAYRLMNNILGQYSLGGRLGDTIRERQGMAYEVHSGIDANVIEGPLTIRAGVAAENVDRTLESIDVEVARLIADGVTAKELEDSRRYLIGSMPRALETNGAIAMFLQQIEFFELGLDYDERVPDMLRAVTVDDVNAAARRSLDPARAAVVIAGPYAE